MVSSKSKPKAQDAAKPREHGRPDSARPGTVVLMTAALAIAAIASVAATACSGDGDGSTDAGTKPQCTPADCTSMGLECGRVQMGGGCIDCGRCGTGLSCGGGGVPNRCGCTPVTCAAIGANCGMAPDRCGGMLNCGTCIAPATCGGGGEPNVCAGTLAPGDDCTPGGGASCPVSHACCLGLDNKNQCLFLDSTDTTTCPPPRADLVVRARETQATVRVESNQDIPANHCGVTDMCITPGTGKTLLRVGISVSNEGKTDFRVEDPRVLTDEACGAQKHVPDVLRFELLDAQGFTVLRVVPVMSGICVEDTRRVWSTVSVRPGYNCTFNDALQGVSVGWAFETRGADCHWLDVTGVPPGDYLVKIEVNPGRSPKELLYANNVATATVTIP